MDLITVEIKAKCPDPGFVRKKLRSREAEFKGVDFQTDTYFNVREGRLKLREGNIENNLIYYRRDNIKGPKQSDVALGSVEPGSGLKEVLSKALGMLIAVKKKREIYFIGNIKFHIDEVEGLGCFVEIEAIDKTGERSRETLLEQCRSYIRLFAIQEDDLIDLSYSDLLIE